MKHKHVIMGKEVDTEVSFCAFQTHPRLLRVSGHLCFRRRCEPY